MICLAYNKISFPRFKQLLHHVVLLHLVHHIPVLLLASPVEGIQVQDNPHIGGHHSSKAVAGAGWGQEMKVVLCSRQVVGISTTEVVISSSKDRLQG